MPHRGGPTIRLRRMGIELRRLRESSGLTLEEAGDLLGRSGSSLSKIENGLVRLWKRDLEQILDRYALTDKNKRDWLIDLSAAGRKKGWWKRYKDTIDPRFLDYVSLEAEATRIRTYEPSLIPGLLQTEEYTRAVMLAVPIRSGRQGIEPFVTIRMARQRVLTSTNPPELHAVIGEAALRQPTGGPDVMRDQLNLLGDMTELDYITLRVLPLSVGTHPGMDGSFSLLDVAPNLHVSVTDHLLGSVYSDQEKDVRHCSVVFDGLCDRALSESDSRRVIRQVATEL